MTDTAENIANWINGECKTFKLIIDDFQAFMNHIKKEISDAAEYGGNFEYYHVEQAISDYISAKKCTGCGQIIKDLE